MTKPFLSEPASSNSSLGNTDHLRDLMISDNGFVFDPQTGLTYVINPTGADIIRWINSGMTSDVVISRMEEEYDVDEHTAARDYEGFVSSLRRNKLI